MSHSRWLLCSLLCAALVGAGCSGDSGADDASPEGPTPEVETPSEEGGEAEEVVESLTAKLKMRDGGQYARDLAQALGLERNTLCRELGLYDCIDDVHGIALGRVEPYELGIRRPLPVAPVTAPMAVDRIAVAACSQRVNLDFDDSEAGLFAGLVEAGEEATDEDYSAAAAGLIESILRRRAQPEEVTELLAFRDEVDGQDVARSWAFGACFALSTHVEALFY